MECVGQVEIDKAARGVLSAHWPHVPRFDDVRAFGRKAFDGPVDLIAGGFPCQDVSLAGRRAGLAGKRSGLWWQFRRVVRELRPRWVLVENVPGLLSSRGGQDFAVVVRGLVKCGYRIAWRTLDAQFFGLAQRRRCVFLVASFGSGRAVEVLFEPVGMPRDPAPRRKTWEEIAGALGSCSATGGRRATDLDGAGAYIAGALTNRVPTSDASCANQGHILAHPDLPTPSAATAPVSAAGGKIRTRSSFRTRLLATRRPASCGPATTLALWASTSRMPSPEPLACGGSHRWNVNDFKAFRK